MVFAYANEEMEQSLRYKKPLKAPEGDPNPFRREREQRRIIETVQGGGSTRPAAAIFDTAALLGRNIANVKTH